MEENSGVKFQQAMVALARQWVGDIEGPSIPANVSIVIPSDTTLTMPAPEGVKSELKSETYPLPATVEEACKIIEQFEHGADELRSDEVVSDNVAQHMLNDRTALVDEEWLGTPEEEKGAYVSELLYIHSKLMIVDDRRVIVSDFHYSNGHSTDFVQMGSANINDRSQKVSGPGRGHSTVVYDILG